MFRLDIKCKQSAKIEGKGCFSKGVSVKSFAQEQNQTKRLVK